MNPIARYALRAALALLAASTAIASTAGCPGTTPDCSTADLFALCPVGTTPRMDIAVERSGAVGAGVDVMTQSGDAQGVWASQGACRVWCEANPMHCPDGIDQVTRDSVICRDPEQAAGCGNGSCDPGETDENCYVDCGGVCEYREERCNGASREVCNRQGRWETLACIAGERCVETGESQTECVASATPIPTFNTFSSPTLVTNPAVVDSGAVINNPAVIQNGTLDSGAVINNPAVIQNGAVNNTALQPGVDPNLLTQTQQDIAPPQQTAQVAQTTNAWFDCEEATFTCLSVASGFLPDPQVTVGRSGGAEQYAECDGYFADVPDHIIELTSDFNFLQVYLDGAAAGTSMIVASLDANGLILCARPNTGSSPRIARRFPAGTYGVFVGAGQPERYYDYRLGVTEYR